MGYFDAQEADSRGCRSCRRYRHYVAAGFGSRDRSADPLWQRPVRRSRCVRQAQLPRTYGNWTELLSRTWWMA